MLHTLGVETHLVRSPAAHVTIAQETNTKVSEVTIVRAADVQTRPCPMLGTWPNGPQPPWPLTPTQRVGRTYAESR